MRRAQRIVHLHEEVVLRAIEWSEALAAFNCSPSPLSSPPTVSALERAESRLDEVVCKLVHELEHLAVSS